jgi:hypothetical protein
VDVIGLVPSSALSQPFHFRIDANAPQGSSGSTCRHRGNASHTFSSKQVRCRVPHTSPRAAGMVAPSLRLRSPTTALFSQAQRPATFRPQLFASRRLRWFAQQAGEPRIGTITPVPDDANPPKPKTRPPFYFEAGYALFAKRPSRPFPPPFLSLPSTSFSEPLSTHNKSRDRRPKVNGEMIRGVTNGDDAVLVSDYFIGANDGVGAWGTRKKGHAA